MPDKNRNLYYLHELSDYKVHADYSDVRGWEVKDADDRTIGKVDNLLVNKESERVVYLDVEVDETIIEEGHKTYEVPASAGIHEFLNKDGEDHLIIPIGMVILDEENEKVHTNKIDYNTFSKTRRFNKGAMIDSDYELMVFNGYVGGNSIKDDEFYDRKQFDNSFHKRNL